MVDEQQLEDSRLGLAGQFGGLRRLDDHALGHRHRAGRLWLGESTTVSGVGDLHQTLAAGSGRVQQRMVAEPGDDGAVLLGGSNDEGALRHAHRLAVDREGDEILLGDDLVVLRVHTHAFTPNSLETPLPMSSAEKMALLS